MCGKYCLLMGVVVWLGALSAWALTGSGVSESHLLETVSPTLQEVVVTGERSLAATFSEDMLAPGVIEPGNYAVSGLGRGALSPAPASVAGGPAAVSLGWASGEMRDGVSLTLTATGVQDMVGNPIRVSNNSGSDTGMGTAPVFSNLVVDPVQASMTDKVTISVSCDEMLQSVPELTVNGHEAKLVGSSAMEFTFSYTVRWREALGMATIQVVGADLAGNLGALMNTDALEITASDQPLSSWGWPWAAAALLALGLLFVWRRRNGRGDAFMGAIGSVSGRRCNGSFLLLLAIAVLASASAFAASPTVSNVILSQSPTATSTQVDIYYDLVSPNGPCDITVTLSKDGGADGYPYPVAAITGDVEDVAPGVGKHIVWDIRADYPEEHLPEARIQVLADDGLIQYTATYLSDENGYIVGLTPQIINHGENGAEATAVGNDLYLFDHWSDGSTQNPRTDINVTADITVTAHYYYPIPVVGQFVINHDDLLTENATVTLHNAFTNKPTHYMASESANFAGASWQPYSTAPSFTLTGTAITRTVYFKTRNIGGESATASDSIYLKPAMVSASACTFRMGRLPNGVNDDRTYGNSDEDPPHDVTLSAYRLGKYEVTNQQYCDVLNWARAQGRLFANTTGSPWNGAGSIYAGETAASRYPAVAMGYSDCNIAYASGVFTPKTRTGLPDGRVYSMAEHPMVRVSWYGSAAFCNWLNEMLGMTPCYAMDTATWPLASGTPAPDGYRLPTEAEWERAAAWDGSRHWVYSFLSDANPSGTANRCNDYNSGTVDNPLGLTATPYTNPVGWFNGINVSPKGNVATMDSPSPVGAYDMSGNVWEWCHDWHYAAYYGGGAMTDPLGPETGTRRVARGGGWYDSFFLNRSAQRGNYYPDLTQINYGFRLRLPATPAPAVVSFSINEDAVSTASATVTLNNACSNSPTEYMASESPEFSGATWQPYSTAPSFVLSSALGGAKTVYFKVRNAGGESATVSDTIQLFVEETILLPGDVPLELVWIPAGTFMMGRYPGEQDSLVAEDPQHQVALTQGFWMGKYEVTQAQWLAVRGSWPGTAPSSSYGVGNNYPAYYVSWNDVQNFVTSLNAHITSTGQGPATVRLPSEAEWEYAYRAGTTTRFYWGDDLRLTQIGGYAWHTENNSPYGTKPVGGKFPNPFGLYDMSGNVWEWCEDDWHGNYTGAPSNGSAWVENPRGLYLLVRGGSFRYTTSLCRAAARYHNPSTARDNNNGFRIVRAPMIKPALSVTPSNREAPYNAGAMSFSIETTSSWTASSDVDWAQLSATAGTGATSLTVNCTQNQTAMPRTATITIMGNNTEPVSVQATVNQSAMPPQEGEGEGEPDPDAEITIMLPGDVPLELVWIPAGTFMMGRYPGEQDSYIDEAPQHQVTLSQGFWMGKYEVTQAQWLAVRGSWPGSAPSSSYGVGNNYPTYNVSWDDTQNFITSLNAHITSTGQGPATVRLPSEAEWEYACRAGTTTRFYWGDDPEYTQIGSYAWYEGNNSPYGMKPVGGKLPNTFGLYDMSGNVWEYCEDDWHSNYTGAPSNGSAWVDNPRGSYRLFRGGTVSLSGYHCRAANRNFHTPVFLSHGLGFRIVRTP